MKSIKTGRIVSLTIIYIILGVSAIIWLAPIVWLVLQSFSASSGAATSFYPQKGEWTWHNFAYLFSIPDENGLTAPGYASTNAYDIIPSTGMNYFLTWFFNTIVVAALNCIISTLFCLVVAYSMSRFRFKGREVLMKLNLVLGMFPGFLSMIIMYWVMKDLFHLQGSFWALVIIYSAGSGMGFFISKGFFDTISKSIDEAAMIDGANRAQIFWDIILPLSKPIIVYTILTSFMAPWGDYVTSSYIIGANNAPQWTVAIGLYKWANERELFTSYYTRYAAGSVVIALPMILLFLFTQKYYVAGVTGGAVKG